MNYWSLLKKPFFGQFRKPWRWPSTYDDIGRWKAVQFRSDSGATLKGLYGASTANKTIGNIVCAHPMCLGAKAFFIKHGQANMLRDQGFNVFLFDFNGFGESGDGDYNLPADILAAGNTMAKIAPEYPIGFYGISFGAACGICACALDNQPYKAALFESPFTTLEEYWRKYPFPYFVLRLGSIFFSRQASDMRPIEKIAKIRGLKSILWVYGDADKDTPAEMGSRFMDASPVSSELWIVPGAPHTACFSTSPGEFTTRAVNFFSTTLG